MQGSLDKWRAIDSTMECILGGVRACEQHQALGRAPWWEGGGGGSLSCLLSSFHGPCCIHPSHFSMHLGTTDDSPSLDDFRGGISASLLWV